MSKCQTTLKLPVIQLRTNSSLKNDDNHRNVKGNTMSDAVTKYCPKLANSFNRTKWQNIRKLWKVPAKFHPQQKNSNNVVAYSGLRDRRFKLFYAKLANENTVILPPNSHRLRDNFHDGLSIQEKYYVNKYVSRTGKLERFIHDEVYVPNVYARFLTCADCRLSYATAIFNQSFVRRIDPSPAMCQKVTQTLTLRNSPSSSVQYCDVLGERYCTECIRLRNRNFSLKIENSGVLKAVEGRRRPKECVHFNG